jgi:hypothetical protein
MDRGKGGEMFFVVLAGRRGGVREWNAPMRWRPLVCFTFFNCGEGGRGNRVLGPFLLAGVGEGRLLGGIG